MIGRLLNESLKLKPIKAKAKKKIKNTLHTR